MPITLKAEGWEQDLNRADYFDDHRSASSNNIPLNSVSERPARSILFLATTGEEPGSLGSEYFSTHSSVRMANVVAAINIDGPTLMLFPVRNVEAMGASNSSLANAVDATAMRIGVTVKRESLPPGASDHYSFVRQGVPTLWIVGGSETSDGKLNGSKMADEWVQTRYHTPKDDLSQPLDFGAAVTLAQLNFLIGYRVAQDDARPRWNVGDFFGEKFGREAQK